LGNFEIKDFEIKDVDVKDEKPGRAVEGAGIALQEETGSRLRIETSRSLCGMT
jgi:hypothetical protein